MHSSSSCLQVLFWSGIAAFGCAAALAIAFLLLQASRQRSSQEELAFLHTWQPLLLACLHAAVPAALPVLEIAHRPHFLKQWNRQMRNSSEEARNRLVALAYAVGCASFCRRTLRNGNRIERLLATLTLGQMRDHAAWDTLVNQTMAADHLVSLHAFHALVRIDADIAAQQLTPLMLARTDWPVAQLAGILQSAQGAFQQPLIEAVQDTRAAHMPRTLRLIEALRFSLPQGSIRQLLDTADSNDVLIGTLRIINDVGLLPQARAYLRHEDWRVRVQAAKLLGRVGEHADVNRLIPLLADAEWWVRYRAAQSLAGMPFFSRAELELLRHNLSDRFARDMLGQVLAEKDGIVTLGGLLFWGSTAYVGLAHAGGLLLHLSALSGLRHAEQESMLAELPHVHSGLEPPVSLVLHADGDAARIAASTAALLALHYPALEVIVVIDAAPGDTMAALRQAFELLPFPEAYRIQLPTQEITQIYRSMRHANLRVLDKKPGNRADGWNAGINAARTPLVCCIDCDISLRPDGLHHLALPFLGDADTIATSGIVDACGDDSASSRTGFVSSLRTRLFAPLGWSAVNALLVAPSGVQLLRKDAVIQAGGYESAADAPQIDMLMRLHGTACEQQRPYRIAFVADTVGSRQSAAIRNERAQCIAWQGALLDSASRHRALPWRTATRGKLRLAFLFLILFECFGPLLELASYAWVVIAAATGLISPSACIAFFTFAIGSGVLLSVSGLLLDAVSLRRSREVDMPGGLLLAACAENLGYRQRLAYWRTLGLAAWLRR